MRVNVYTEELVPLDQPMAEIVTTEYVSSRTGEKMTNYGLRIYVKSHPDLHYLPGRDDDRSAVTFWCGPKESSIFALIDIIRAQAYSSTLDTWRKKTTRQQTATEGMLREHPNLTATEVQERYENYGRGPMTAALDEAKSKA